MQRKILITGGAGFVGSSIAISLKQKYPQYAIVCLDNLKRRGSELNIPRLVEQGIEFIHGDIRNREDLHRIEGLTTLIESSAEPSVMAGLNSSPDYVINTNLLGTVNCLSLAAKTKADFIFLSSSRVYPIEKINSLLFLENENRFSLTDQQKIGGASAKGIAEKFPLDGFRSFYGASKLASELLIQEYNQFYNLQTVINRCGVIAGPWQMGKIDQGIIVHWIVSHFWKQELSYFGFGGKGKQVRDLLHVKDLCELIDFQVHNLEKVNGKTFNAGGGIETSISLCELTDLCQEITGNKISVKSVIEDRQADIRIYVTDNSSVSSSTGWKPTASVEKIVTDIFDWIRGNEKLLKPILRGKNNS